MDDTPLRRLLARGAAGIAGRLHQAWHEPPAAPCRARHGIDIALVPSRLVRRLGHAFTLVQATFGVELLLLGHGLAAAMVLALALLPRLHGRLRRSGGSAAPRRLLVAADGRLHLLHVAGEVEAVSLHGSSLRLGPWLLLALRGAGGRLHRLLLGPDNVPPDVLAALQRRMHLLHQAAEAVAPGLASRLSPASPARRPQSQ